MFFTTVMRLIIMLCVAGLLCQCAQTAETHLQPIPQKAHKQYNMSCAEYLTLANNETGIARQSLLITAAARALHDNQWRKAQAILAQTAELTPIQSKQKQILLAKSEIIRQYYRPALKRLAILQDINQLPAPYPVLYHEILAQAYQHTGAKIESIIERIALETILPDEKSRQNNQRALWSNLMTFSQAELDTIVIETADNPALQGWAELALISKKNNNKAIITALDSWQNKFPTHDANRLLPDPLSLIAQKMHPVPKQIALLLPLTGVLAGPGNAVKDGFMVAARQDNSQVKIQVYDTQTQEVAALYTKAITEGADYVVGPLSKTDVASIAAINNPVPTLLLNEIDMQINNNTYQFGLSPSNEAIQIAMKAANQGHTRALIIAPEGSWGNEIVQAFTKQWQSNDGKISDTVIYKNNADLTQLIRDALHIPFSEARERQIKRLLGEKIQTRIARRDDVDMIFLLAYPSKARQIMPLLKYYYAGDLPVYATSAVYAGNINSMKDKDLNGIIFCDMPWVFTHQMGNKQWPEQFNSYNRLYALGMDSYALATQLNQLMVFPTSGFTNNNGLLYLTPANHIARMLEWGQFKAGQAELIV